MQGEGPEVSMSGQPGREQKVGTCISRAVQSRQACSFYLPLCLPAFLFHCLSWKSAVAVLGSLALSMYQMLPVLPPLQPAAKAFIPGHLQVSCRSALPATSFFPAPQHLIKSCRERLSLSTSASLDTCLAFKAYPLPLFRRANLPAPCSCYAYSPA